MQSHGNRSGIFDCSQLERSAARPALLEAPACTVAGTVAVAVSRQRTRAPASLFYNFEVTLAACPMLSSRIDGSGMPCKIRAAASARNMKLARNPNVMRPVVMNGMKPPPWTTTCNRYHSALCARSCSISIDRRWSSLFAWELAYNALLDTSSHECPLDEHLAFEIQFQGYI